MLPSRTTFVRKFLLNAAVESLPYTQKREAAMLTSLFEICYTVGNLCLLASFDIGALHKSGLSTSSGVGMHDPALCGPIDYAHSLAHERRGLGGVCVHRSLGLLYECLDAGLSVRVPRSKLARLLNIFDNRFDIWQLGFTPCNCRRKMVISTTLPVYQFSEANAIVCVQIGV